jgi:hypothetical protein
MESMELSHAEKIIGVGKDYDMKHALKCFEVVHWAKIENREFNLLANVLGAKNSLMRHLITEQKKRFRFFEIESPFDNTCSKCQGSGELYKFFKKSVKVNCHICGGSSNLEDNCPICKGNGRYIRRWKQGGGVNLECKRCQGKGKVKVSCRECKGKGQLKKAVLSDELKSTTPCKNCRQLGFIVKDSQKSKKQKHFRKEPRQIFQPFPVKSRDGKTLADLIKKG